MLIAVPSEAPGGLEATISAHFGHCHAFTMVNVDGELDITGATVCPLLRHDGLCRTSVPTRAPSIQSPATPCFWAFCAYVPSSGAWATMIIS